MLAAIAWAEGTADDADGGYGRVVRGTVISAPDNPSLVGQTNVTITDLSHHPNILVQVSAGLQSTAAGRYQFLNGTWNGFGLPDFTAHNQDIGAVMLLRRAMNSIEKGNIETAVSLVNGTWASLPGSPWGQSTRTMAGFQEVYDSSLADCNNGPVRIR
jgi:muramidase (phage lysozyme)